MNDNIYIILNLDENKTDIANINAIFQRKKKEWNRWKVQGTPNQQKLANNYLGKEKEIESIIKDRKLIIEEQKKYKKYKISLKKGALDELDNMIKALSSNKITQQQYKLIVNKLKNRLVEKEIRDRISKLGIIISSNKSPKKKREIKPLDFSKIGNINRLLQDLNKQDLYDFLDLKQTSSVRLLLSRADEIYKNIFGKKGNENDIKNQLIGYCRDLFKSEEDKERYDYTLSLQSLKKLDAPLEISGADKVLTKQEIKNILNIASKYNISSDDALDYIYAKAEKKNWTIVEDAIDIEISKCIFCSALIDIKVDRKCKSCGALVKQPCPICKNSIYITEKSCKSCGLYISDIPTMKERIAKVDDLLNLNNIIGAEKEISQILNLWGNWKEAQLLSKKIKNLKLKEVNELKDIKQLISQKFYYKAQRLLNDYIKKYDKTKNSEVIRLEKEIESQIKKVDLYFQKAEKAFIEKRWSDAVRDYELVLSYIKDHKIAEKKLSQIPIVFDNSNIILDKNLKVRINWSISSIENISFSIIRKKDTPPTNNKDGIEIAKTHNNIYIDNINSGGIYYYAIYPIRNGVTLEKGNILEPIFIPYDVKNFSITKIDKKVQLSWELPKDAIGIELYRNIGDKKFNKEDGEKIVINKLSNSYIDNSVKQGNIYTYLIIANYIDVKTNKKISSKGIYKSINLLGTLKNQIRVNYEVKKSKKFILFGSVNSLWVEMKSIYEDLKLSDIVIVLNKERVPLNMSDGDIIKNMKSVTFTNGLAKINISKQYFNKKGYIKIFFKQTNKAIRLIPAKENKLKI